MRNSLICFSQIFIGFLFCFSLFHSIILSIDLFNFHFGFQFKYFLDFKLLNLSKLVSDLNITPVAVKHGMTEADVEKIYMKVKRKWFDDRLERHFVSTRQKAEKGDVEAQFKLGNIYYGGLAPDGPDWKEAVKWWLNAAQEGHVEAQERVGAAIMGGYGVKGDDITGYAWCQIAEINGHPDAKIVKEHYSKDMTAEEIEKAEVLTKEMVIKNSKLTKK